MRLFVIRHAEAVPRSSDIDDASRPLTEEGLRRWRRAVRGFERLGMKPERVYHSPWVRAVATAEELIERVEGERVATRRLAEAPSPALLRELKGECVAVVGHQPWLGELVELLVLGRANSGAQRAWLELGKGAVVWLEGKARPGKMVLRAVLPPKVLRALR
jgi:phosphohistidine phosphatase